MQHPLLNKVFWRRAVVVALPVLAALFLWSVRQVLFPFVLGGLLAYLLAPVVKAVEKLGLSRLPSLVVVYVGLVGLSVLSVTFGYPALVRELTSLLSAIPEYAHKVEAALGQLERQYSNFYLPESLRSVVDQRISLAETGLLRLVHQSADTLMGLMGHLFGLLLAPVLAFYLLKDWELISVGLKSLVPKKIRLDVSDLVRDMDEVVRGFIRGHLVVCALVGGLTALGSYLIGLPFALLVGIFAGVLDIIPFFGPIIGAIPAVALALLQSWQIILYTLFLFVLIQQVESNIITPKILGEAVGLHPIMIIFALLAGGQLWGIIGMVVALPLAAIIRVLARYMFLKLVSN